MRFHKKIIILLLSTLQNHSLLKGVGRSFVTACTLYSFASPTSGVNSYPRKKAKSKKLIIENEEHKKADLAMSSYQKMDIAIAQFI